MKQDASLRNGYCIYIDTFCQGPVPVVSDENGYVIFETELKAQKDIVENQMTRLQQFLDGERDFEDAITVEEYVVPVTVHPDGTITDEAGNLFGSHRNSRLVFRQHDIRADNHSPDFPHPASLRFLRYLLLKNSRPFEQFV